MASKRWAQLVAVVGLAAFARAADVGSARPVQVAGEAGPVVRPEVPTTPLFDPRANWPVGRQADGSVMTATNQWLRPAGRQVEFPGRPTDLALLPGGQRLAVVDRNALRLVDTASGALVTSAASDGGHSVHGIAAKADGRTLYTTSTSGLVLVWTIGEDGALKLSDKLKVPGEKPAPAGLALSADEQTLFVCLNRANSVAALPLVGGGEARTVAVGVAPYDVLRIGSRLYVSNWGGRLPAEGDRVAASSGTPVRVDERTIGSDGSLSVIDLASFAVTAEIPVGLLPSGMVARTDGSRLYVANANSDSISVVDTSASRVIGTIAVKPERGLPFGSGVNALALSPDQTKLYAACGANNAVAVVDLQGSAGRVVGFVPTGWYPGALTLDATGQRLYVANTKGVGSLAKESVHNSHQHQGSVSLIDLEGADLAAWTKQTADNNRAELAAASALPPRRGVAPRPLPERHGEPSLIKHVVYIIRENRTYDQVLGDMPEGNGDPSLVQFGEEVTPNAHALARQFQLLDNFYCSGVLSADGHQWATEGYVSSYLEKSFGGFVRSYPYEGDDALAYSAGGFIWDNVLDHGLTFRSYGEMVQASIKALDPAKSPTFSNIYADFTDDGLLQSFEVRASSKIARVAANLCPTTIGFPSTVPDIYRASEFIRELREFERNGGFPSLSVLLLPNDHTNGTSPNYPKPQSQVADNDLALGRIVEAVTQSRFWPETAILVCQDDPQAGTDHVDGHRSPAFVISPYTPRGTVHSGNYTQVGMIKTIELLLGLPPMNQLDLLAAPMAGCFGETADLTPYTHLPARLKLDDLNPPRQALSGAAAYYADLSLSLPFDRVDEADEDTLNRILWWATRGDQPYPAWAAATAEPEYEDGDS